MNIKKPVPFPFVLEKLDSSSPVVRAMFGCHAIYVSEKLVLVLRKRRDHTHDNGVWLATAPEHHASLKKVFPSLRSIRLFGSRTSSWQNIPAEADDFEESVLTACDMILRNDPRIGRIPGRARLK